MNKKVVIGMVLTLVSISVFAGCVENISYDDRASDSVAMAGFLEDFGFQLYDSKTILYVLFTNHDVPYYFFAPEHDLSGFHWFLSQDIGNATVLKYTDVGLDYYYLYDVNVNDRWFYG